MITESEYWKNDLKKNVSFFHSKLSQTRWREESYAALEKRIMISCYIVRKLAESNKITNELFNQNIRVFSYKNTGTVPDLMNSHKIDELYEVDNPIETEKQLSYIVNQIIHSFTFRFVFKYPNKIEGFVFNSDRSKRKEIYMVKLKDFIQALSPIAQCYIGTTIMRRNENGEMVVVHSE